MPNKSQSTRNTPSSQNGLIDLAIGSALRNLREDRELTARQLSAQAEVSTAMISRIENGQVSPSIATLSALSRALNVPLVSLFRETASHHADITHVKRGEGLKSTRSSDGHSHDYTNLAFHRRRDLQFEAHLITLRRQDARPPIYIGHGVVFIHALEGEAVYCYGQREITLKPGDSLSLDAELNHGFKSVITDAFKFLSVQAEARR
ncbi:MAG: helix-turn-helix transcriptional regulator [Rhodospirillaceae bacterium]|nr:helix-turn-helix transcriptional regulator [Rhodospirillaceae bacterium]MBT6139075.1 helix-turn-helix transcriptional regulator [Rhodospirillaceae bacterium]